MLIKALPLLLCSGLFSVFAGNDEGVEVALADLISHPENYLGKVVKTTGTVDHVCKHGAKKLLIFADTPESSIHVVASDTVPVFDAEANGADVLVKGTVKENRITRAQVMKLIEDREQAEEKGNAKPSMSDGEGPGHGMGPGQQHDHGTTEGAQHPLLQEMDASGKDYVSEFYVQCIEYSIVK